MGKSILSGALFALVTAFPSAHGASAAESGEGNQQVWRTKTDFSMNVRAFGYAPAEITDPGGNVRVQGDSLLRHRGDFQFRLFVHGHYLHLEAFPYTVVPEPEDGGYRVSLAGLELNLLAVARDWLRVGLYHHSAHNFSEEELGNGIDLNAVVVDAEVLRGSLGVVHGGRYRLNTVLHYYSTDKASPYVITQGTDVDASRMGNIKWRLMAGFAAVDDADRRANCLTSVSASSSAVASATTECDLLFSPGERLFGALGDHLFIGPYFRYGQNLHRSGNFGRNAVLGGIRLRLLVSEDGEDLKFR